LLLAFNDAKMQQKIKALDLSIGLKSQKKIFNLGYLEAKARKNKEEEDVIQEIKEQPIEEEIHFLFATPLAKKLVDKDLNLDFMDSDRREKLSDLYLSEPRALPGKEIKPLKNSKLDKFANNIEINFHH
jgi:hypothetical protein